MTCATSFRFAPRLTTLEGRDCASASAIVSDHTLYLMTDPGSDAVDIRDDGKGRLTATVRGADGVTFAGGTGIDKIFVHLRGTHDKLTFTPTPGAKPVALTIDTGRPGNAVVLNFAAGNKAGYTVDLRGDATKIDAWTGKSGLTGVAVFNRTDATVVVHKPTAPVLPVKATPPKPVLAPTATAPRK